MHTTKAPTGEQTYYLVHDENGKVIGHGYSPDGTILSNSVACTPEHKEHWDLCEIHNGVIHGPSPEQMMKRMEQKKVDETHMNAASAGLQIASLSCPEVNGTYAVDHHALQRLSGVCLYIQTHSKFPGSSGDMLAWSDINFTPKVFKSLEVFGAFAKAVHDYATDLDLYKAKALSELPPCNVTIA